MHLMVEGVGGKLSEFIVRIIIHYRRGIVIRIISDERLDISYFIFLHKKWGDGYCSKKYFVMKVRSLSFSMLSISTLNGVGRQNQIL